MSNYGLVTGLNGNIQFDTNRKVLGLLEHDSASTWTAISAYTGTLSYKYEISSDYIIAAIAVKPSYSTTVIGRSDSFLLMPLGIIQSGTDTIEYAVYSPDVNDIHALPTWGLVTYNEDGDVVFNSDVNYLKIVDIKDIDRSTLLNWGSVTINHDVKNPFYIIPNNWGGGGYAAPGPGGGGTGALYRSIGVRKLSETSAKIEWFYVWNTPPVMGFGYKLNDFFNVPNPFRVAICTL